MSNFFNFLKLNGEPISFKFLTGAKEETLVYLVCHSHSRQQTRLQSCFHFSLSRDGIKFKKSPFLNFCP
jgi:hypothetical protein